MGAAADFLARLKRPGTAPGGAAAAFLRRLKGVTPRGSVNPLTAKFQGTGARPTSEFSAPEEVGAISGFPRLARRTLEEGVVGPIAGVGEVVGVVPEGVRQGFRERFEEERDRYLSADPTTGRAIASGVSELVANAIPIAPGGPLGKLAAKGLKATGKAAKVLTGAGAGLAEGSVIAVGDRPLSDPEVRNRNSLIALGGATAFGGLGGAKAAAAKAPADLLEDSIAKAVADFDKVTRQGPQPKPGPQGIRGRIAQVGSRLHEELINSLAPIEKFGLRSGIPGAKKVAILAQKVRVGQSIARSSVFDATRDGEFRVTGESLQDVVKDIPHGIDADADLNRYMAAGRHLELAGRAEANKIRKAELQEELASFKGKRGKEAADIRREIGKELREIRELKIDSEATKVSEEFIAAMHQKYGTVAGAASVRPRLLADDRVHDLWLRREIDDLDVIHDALENVGVRDVDVALEFRAHEKGVGPTPALGRSGGEANHLIEVGNAFDEGIKELAEYRSRGRVAVLDSLAERVTSWSRRAIIDPLVEAGVLSARERTRILGLNERYAPFFRALDELGNLAAGDPIINPHQKGIPVKGKFITEGLSFETGKRIEPDIVPLLADRAMRVQVFANQQKLRNTLADLADGNPALAAEVRLADPAASPKNTFPVFREGERLTYTGSQGILRALNTLNPAEGKNVLSAASNMATRVFRAAATLTPAFGVRNLGRDSLTFGVYTQHGGIPFIDPARFMLGELIQRLTGKGSSQDWRDMMASPGSHATFLSGDRWHLDRELKVARENIGKSAPTRFAKETLSNPLLPFQFMADTFEKFSRFAEFKLARKGGRKTVAGLPIPGTLGKGGKPLSIGEAGGAMADVTINFPRAGRFGRAWNQHEAFVNAMFQDVDKFTRSMKAKPLETMVKGFAYLTAPALANWAMNSEDPDYQSLGEWEKTLFLHVGRTENGRWIRVPMPPGILTLLFAYLPQKAMDHFLGDKAGNPVSKIKARERATHALMQETPLKYTPIGGAQDWVINLMPQVLQPLVEAAANRSPFFDRPVVPQRLQNIRPISLQSQPGTSGVARGVGESTGTSPAIIDHLIRGYGASMGRNVAESLGGTRQPDLPGGLQDIPGIGGLVSSSPVGFGSQPARDFFDLAERAEGLESGFKIQETSEQRQDFLKLHPEVRYAKHLRRTQSKLQEYAALRRRVRVQSGLTPSQREEQLLKIDQQITAIAGLTLVNVLDALETR